MDAPEPFFAASVASSESALEPQMSVYSVAEGFHGTSCIAMAIEDVVL